MKTIQVSSNACHIGHVPRMPAFKLFARRVYNRSGCQDNQEKSREKDKEKPLPSFYIISHGLLRFALTYSDITLFVMKTLYVEVLHLGIDVMAFIEAVVQVVDLLGGLVYGYASQLIPSTYVRRIPFALAGSLASAFGIRLLARPPVSADSTTSDAPVCPSCASQTIENCSLVQHCLSSPSLLVEEHSSPGAVLASSHSNADLAIYMLLAEICRRVLGSRLVTLSLESFGVEAIFKAVPQQYSSFLGYLSAFAFAGNLCASIICAAAALRYPSDVAKQAQILAQPITVLFPVAGISVFIAAALFVKGASGKPKAINVKKLKPGKEANGDSFVPMLLELMSFKPYVQVLKIELIIRIGNAWHFGNLFLFMKYNIQAPNAMVTQLLYGMQVSISSLLFAPIVASLTGRFQNENILSCGLGLGFSSFAYAICKRPSKLTLMVLPILIGFIESCNMILLPGMFVTVVRYDELLTNRDRAGFMVTLKNAVEQLLLIGVSMIPGLLLKAVDYLPNSGCSCGCGAACPCISMAWSCPADTGFICFAAGAAEPAILGPERPPGCSAGQSIPVKICITLLVFGFPAIGFAASCMTSYFFVLRGRRDSIEDALFRRQNGVEVRASVVGKSIPNDAVRHFSKADYHKAEIHGMWHLRRSIGARSGITGLLLFVIITVSLVDRSQAIVLFPLGTFFSLAMCLELRQVYELLVRGDDIHTYINVTKMERYMQGLNVQKPALCGAFYSCRT